jgi:signal transduction histidine kinase
LEQAVAAERSRLARDLHDAVTQTLFSASLIAEALPGSWERDREEGQLLLKELRQLSRGALAEMRTLLLELRPAALVEAKLGDLLHQLAEAGTGREGLPITVTVEGERRLPPDVHVALYRIAQEGLNNAIKHSRATHAQVHLRYLHPAGGEDGEGDVELRIYDDGRGFDPGDVSADHLGLDIMRERADAIGARLEVESQPGLGTQIVVTWKERAE